jgi:hypothetical protein
MVRMPPGKPRKTIVHLGNIGYTYNPRHVAPKTQRLAERFPNVDFIGIDTTHTRAVRAAIKRKNFQNWRQIRADFKSGLEQLPDNSISVISSELALGHYSPTGKQRIEGKYSEEYTSEVLKVAYKKLADG